MIGLFLVTHGTLGEALIQCVCHVLDKRPPLLGQLGLSAGEDPADALPLARRMIATVDDGEGVLLLADLLYMHVLGAIVPVQALVGAHQVGDIGASVRALLQADHLWLVPAPLAGLALALAWPVAAKEQGPDARARRRVWLVGLAVMLAACAPIGLALGEAMRSGLGARSTT